MIGHAMPAAGIAGLIKVALALHHKVLPPTINVDEPNPELGLDKTPFYINTETRPWIHGADAPRRAGVNAFGFGGINAHVILEEHPGDDSAAASSHSVRWETEVFVLSGSSRAELLDRIQRFRDLLRGHDRVELADLAYTLNVPLDQGPFRLALVAGSVEELQQKLQRAAQRLADPRCHKIKEVHGLYFFAEPLAPGGRLAFLFPGEGSQYINMLATSSTRSSPGTRAAMCPATTSSRGRASRPTSEPPPKSGCGRWKAPSRPCSPRAGRCSRCSRGWRSVPTRCSATAPASTRRCTRRG
jgi:acyl transferase domain-containing protein